jgi:hypothetical protein
MSSGGLDGKVVALDFWPTCETCHFFAECKLQRKHPAYPHSWHWGREFAAFADGCLVTRSWVGTTVIGQPHTGCESYQVDTRYISGPQLHHRLYLDLEHEKGRLEAEMAALEKKKTWTRTDEEFHAALFGRFRRVLEQQEALLSAVDGARPLAAAVNE